MSRAFIHFYSNVLLWKPLPSRCYSRRVGEGASENGCLRAVTEAVAGDLPEVSHGHTRCHCCQHNTQGAEGAALILSDTQKEQIQLQAGRTLDTAAGEDQTYCDMSPARTQVEEERIHKIGAPCKNPLMSQWSEGT